MQNFPTSGFNVLDFLLSRNFEVMEWHDKGISIIKGILNKLKNFSILTAACLYRSILEIVATLSVKFEMSSMLAFEVEHAIELATSGLNELLGDEDSELEKARITVEFESNKIARKFPRPGHMKRKAEHLTK